MHHNACDLLYVRRFASHTDGSALVANQRCKTGGCLGRTCFVKVSWRSLLWSKSSLISRTDCWCPGRRRLQRSSMMCRMPLVLETHSMRPQLSAKMTTLKVWTSMFRRRASGFFCSSWLTMTPNCIIRESFLKSPRRSALQRKAYIFPSVPRKVSFFGLSLVLNTSTVSRHLSVHTCSGNGSNAIFDLFRIRGICAVIWDCSGTKTFHFSVDLWLCPTSLGKCLSRLMVGAFWSGGVNVASALRSTQTLKYMTMVRWTTLWVLPTSRSMSFPSFWCSLSEDLRSWTICQPAWCGYATNTFMMRPVKTWRMSVLCTRLISWGRTTYHIHGSMVLDCRSISARASFLCRSSSQQSQVSCRTRLRMKCRRLLPRCRACRYPRRVKVTRFRRSNGQTEDAPPLWLRRKARAAGPEAPPPGAPGLRPRSCSFKSRSK
mmetsp:Transcript_105083/g.313924  ORF Transcript_105083/g.313924 Transcript_105083/m.313924 type:complete len:432 (-) Transcript_105083:424-1719(-)